MKAFVLLFVCCAFIVCALSQEIRKAEPVYHMSLEDYRATVAHREQLSNERIAQLEQSLKDSQNANAANAKTAVIIPDLQKQVLAQDSEISALKRADFWHRWEYSIIGIFVGLAVAIGTTYAAKMGLLGASATASLAKFAAKV